MRIKLRESDKLGMHKEQKQATVSKVRVGGAEMRLKASPRVATEPIDNVSIFLRFFFLMWTIFKVFVEFVTILCLFYVLDFGLKASEILDPQPGIEPIPPVLEGEVLTTEPPGKSLDFFLSTELETGGGCGAEEWGMT